MINSEKNHMPIYRRKTTKSITVNPQTRPRTFELEMALYIRKINLQITLLRIIST